MTKEEGGKNYNAIEKSPVNSDSRVNENSADLSKRFYYIRMGTIWRSVGFTERDTARDEI